MCACVCVCVCVCVRARARLPTVLSWAELPFVLRLFPSWEESPFHVKTSFLLRTDNNSNGSSVVVKSVFLFLFFFNILA